MKIAISLVCAVFVTWTDPINWSSFSQPVNIDVLDWNRNSVSVKLEYVKFDNVNLRDNNLSLIRLNHSQIMDSDLTNVSFKIINVHL